MVILRWERALGALENADFCLCEMLETRNSSVYLMQRLFQTGKRGPVVVNSTGWSDLAPAFNHYAREFLPKFCSQFKFVKFSWP